MFIINLIRVNEVKLYKTFKWNIKTEEKKIKKKQHQKCLSLICYIIQVVFEVFYRWNNLREIKKALTSVLRVV